MSGTTGADGAGDPLREVPACVDRVATHFARPPLDGEIARARVEFDQQRGAVCDDEELFGNHVAAFLEWYAIDRPLGTEGPPVTRALQLGGIDSPHLLRALARSQHSLFEVVDPRLAEPQGLRLLDLVGGGLWRVDLELPMAGLTRGDIFEARLIPWEGRVRFGPVFCYHPREARTAIHEVVSRGRALRWSRFQVICALARMRLKHSRCRNMPAARIYTVRGMVQGE